MSKKAKWRESFQKARSLSQASLGSSGSFTLDLRRTSSVMEEETTDQELQEYLDALKQKSGIKNLWTGEKFLKAVRNEEDKTPDISITSEEENANELEDIPSESYGDDDDFKPKLMILSRSPSPEELDATESSVNPFQGIQLKMDDLDLDDHDLNNNTDYKVTSEGSAVSEAKEIKSINNNLSTVIESEVDTDDDVTEEIENDTHMAPVSDRNDVSLHRNETPVNYDYSSFKSDSDNDKSNSEKTITHDDSESKRLSRTGSTESEGTDSRSHRKSSKHSRSYKNRKESHSCTSESSGHLRSQQSSRVKHKSRRTHSSRSQITSEHNRLTREVGVQTSSSVEKHVPSGLGVGMATSGPALGMQYVDPSPIATHAVASEALEAMTAYNPAVIALNDMLRQQIRLVDQFVESNRRMYEAYTRNLTSTHRYTTLEDTLQYIKQNRPRTVTMAEAMEEVRRDER